MRSLSLLLSASALMLAACGDKDASGPQSKADIAAEAAETAEIQPGQYEGSVEFTRFEIPGLPTAAAAQVRSQMEQAMAVKQNYCMSAADAAEGRRGRLSKLANANGNCQLDQYQVNGEAVTGRMICSSSDGSSATMTFNGTIGATSSNMAISTELGSPASPNVKAHIDMRVTSRRTGDCTAGAAN